MDNDAARHDLVEALALVQEQMADLAAIEQKRAELSATATAADETVTVTVDADGIVSETVVDKAYLDHHPLADLGDHVTAAAQAAVHDVQNQWAELLAPLAERRARFPSLSEVVDGAPDLRNLVGRQSSATRGLQFSGESHEYPTVRSHR